VLRLVKTCEMLPHTQYGRATFRNIFTWPLSWWRPPLDVIRHGLYGTSFWCTPMGRYLTPHRYSTHTCIWVSSQSYIGDCLPYHWITRSHMVQHVALCVDHLNPSFPLSLDQLCIFSSFLINDDVLKMSMNIHGILFFKTHLQYAQLYIWPFFI